MADTVVRFRCRGSLHPTYVGTVSLLLREGKTQEAYLKDQEGRRAWCMEKLGRPYCNNDLTDTINSLGEGEHVIVCPVCGTQISVRKSPMGE